MVVAYAGVLRSRIGKVKPDVAQRRSPQQGVAQRMHGHIAVGVRHASLVVFQIDPAEPQPQPRRQGVYVVTVPHPEAVGKSHVHIRSV